MSRFERRRIVDQLAPAWPAAAREHLAVRARSFTEIFALLVDPAAQGVTSAAPDAEAVDRVDELATAWARPVDSWPAKIVGGPVG